MDFEDVPEMPSFLQVTGLLTADVLPAEDEEVTEIQKLRQNNDFT
jgi:hypothetical protein